MRKIDRSDVNIFDLAHYFSVFLRYEEESIFDCFPNRGINGICKTLAKTGLVKSADTLKQRALEYAEDSIYESDYKGFDFVCKALNIEDDFENGTELYCVILAIYAKHHPDFLDDCLNRIELTQADFEQEDWEIWDMLGGVWNSKARLDLTSAFVDHYYANIRGKGL